MKKCTKKILLISILAIVPAINNVYPMQPLQQKLNTLKDSLLALKNTISTLSEKLKILKNRIDKKGEGEKYIDFSTQPTEKYEDSIRIDDEDSIQKWLQWTKDKQITPYLRIKDEWQTKFSNDSIQTFLSFESIQNNLEALEIAVEDCKTLDLSKFKKLKALKLDYNSSNIESLTLPENTLLNFEYVPKFKVNQYEELIKKTKGTLHKLFIRELDKNIIDLSNFVELKVVTLYCNLDNINFSNNQPIETLEISSENLNDNNLNQILSKIKNSLKILGIRNCKKISSTTELKKCINLTTLDITNTSIKPEGINNLPKSLVTLIWQSSQKNPSNITIENFPNLTKLDLCEQTELKKLTIKNCPKLERTGIIVGQNIVVNVS